MLLSSNVFSTTYYCDPSITTNTTTNTGKTKLSPWPRLDKVFSTATPIGAQLVAGDSVILLPGNHGVFTIRYKYASDVTFMAAPGDIATLSRVSMLGASHVKLQNLTVSRAYNITTAPMTLGDCIATDNLSDHITIDQCFMYHILDASLSTEDEWANFDDGLNIAAYHSILTNNHIMNVGNGGSINGIGTIFSHNLVENFAYDGLRSADDSITIEYNIVRNAYIKDDGHDDLLQISSHGNVATGKYGQGTVYGDIIRGNQFISMELNNPYPQVAVGTKVGPSGRDWTGVAVTPQGIGCFNGFYEDFVVENNLVVVEIGHGISFFGAINCKIINNTVVPNALDLSPVDYGKIAIYDHKERGRSRGNIVRNNIAKELVIQNRDSSTVEDYNLIGDAFTSYFINYGKFSVPDYHLKVGSPGIAAGASLYAPTTDLEGNFRMNPYDLGCFSSRAVGYYCDPVTGSMSNNGSSSSPWSTLEAVFAANKTFNSGDVINLRTGFHGAPTIKGINSSNVVIQPEPGNVPTLSRLKTLGASNWSISGLTISPELASPAATGGNVVELDATSNHIALDSCLIYSANNPASFSQTQWEGMATGISTAAPYSLINNCHIKNVNNGAIIDGSNSSFTHNLVENIAGNGLQTAGDNSKFEYNVVKNFYVKNANQDNMFASASHAVGGGVAGSGTVKGVELRGNQFIAMTTPILYPTMMQDANGVKVQPRGIACFDGFYENWVIENNLVVAEDANSISLYGAVNCKVLNNTIVENPANINTDDLANLGIFDHQTRGVSSGNLVRNNFAKSISIAPSTLTTTVDHNIAASDYSNYFVNYLNYNFKLNPDGAAVNMGSEIGTPSIDLEQHTRELPYDIGCYQSPKTKTVYASGDLTAMMNAAKNGEIINLIGTSYTYTARVDVATQGKSLTIQADPSLTTRPVITCSIAAPLFYASGAIPQELTLRGLEFDGNAISTALIQGKVAAGGNLRVTVDNCKTSNFATATTSVMFQYASSTGLTVYDDLTVKNSQFFGPYPSALLATSATTTSPNNITFSNCLVKGIKPASISLIKVIAATPLNSITIDHCTFQDGVTGTNSTSKLITLPAGTPQTVKNCIFIDQPATYANTIDANAANVNNVIYNCAGTPALRWVNFGTLLTTNPLLNTYNYTTAASYMHVATDGKAIGFAPKLNVVVTSFDNANTIQKNSTLQMTAVVTDSLSAFSPAVTWTTNSTQGSTIDASTGLFTASNNDETVIITATTDYGYFGTKTINVSTVSGLNNASTNAVRILQNTTNYKVLGIEDTAYTVYSITGSLISIGNIENGIFRMNANKGVYVLKANGKVVRFIVK
jgi:hypothetical protein